MSNKEDFEVSLTAIQALPRKSVKEPNMPVDTFVQEAEDLYTWCQDDVSVLVSKGLTEEKILEIPVRAGACREAQSRWMKESRSQDLWNAQSPAAYDLRDELLHDFRYAFRNNDSLLARVDEIAKGDGHEDMVQDLNDLAVLGTENQDLLTAIGFDLTKLETAAGLSDQMAELLAVVNGTKTGDHDAKYLRDQAYTYLKELVDEVRECGKYVFWKNESRSKGYSSAYWRKKNSVKTTTKSATNTEGA